MGRRYREEGKNKDSVFSYQAVHWAEGERPWIRKASGGFLKETVHQAAQSILDTVSSGSAWEARGPGRERLPVPGP